MTAERQNVDRVMPEAVDSERSLLGGLLQDPVQLVEIGRALKPSDFYRPDHGALFGLLQVMHGAGIGIDLVTVVQEMMKGSGPDRYGGAGYVCELPESCPSTSNLQYYAGHIFETSIRRDLIRKMTEALDDAYGRTIPPATLAARTATDLVEAGTRASVKQTLWPMPDAHEQWKTRQTDVETGGVPQSLPTGMWQLDEMLTGGGLVGGQLVVVGGRPGMGKTGFALALACNVARLHRPVLFVTLEQRVQEMHLRALAITTGRSAERLNHADPEDELLDEHSNELEHLVFFDQPAGVGDIDREAQRMVARYSTVSLVVVDYLQLMTHERDRGLSTADSIGRTMAGLKALAKKCNCPVVVLSQLNREVEKRSAPRTKNPEQWWKEVAAPEPADLRDSGHIEANADIILFPISAQGYGVTPPTLGAVVVAKHRNGPTGAFGMAWDGPCGTYRDWRQE